MNNQKIKKITKIIDLIEKDFKVTNLNIAEIKVTIDFKTRGADKSGKKMRKLRKG